MKWSTNKKKMSKQELKDKVVKLKMLQFQPILDMVAIKNLEKEIELWL